MGACFLFLPPLLPQSRRKPVLLFGLGGTMTSDTAEIVHEFALLAPVPLMHLESALGVSDTETQVSFGSNNFQFFRDLDGVREGAPIPAMIYASHEGELKHNFEVSWVGWYSGKDEGRPVLKLRPPTARGEKWATHWYVKGLRELSANKRMPMSMIEKLSGGKWKAGPVRGPTKVLLSENLHSALHDVLIGA